jgi:hypothetical protein
MKIYAAVIMSAVVLAVAAGTARAQGRKDVERALSSRISVGFVETPFEKAIDYVRRQARLNMVIDRVVADKRLLKQPITFQVDDIPVGEVLDWVTRLADLAYELGDREVIISSRRAIFSKRVILRIYDVKALVRDVDQFPGPDAWPGSPLEGSLHVSAPGNTTRALSTTTLAEMVRERISPGSWAAELCTSIEARGGKLVVVQVPEIHDSIEALLEHLARSSGQQVALEFSVVRAPTTQVEEALAKTTPDGSLSEEGLRLLDPVEAARTDRLVASSRLNCFNGQRIHTFSGRHNTYVGDYDATGTTYDPVVEMLLEGMMADVNPLVSGDGTYVLMPVKLTHNLPADESVWNFRAIGPEAGDEGIVPSGAPTPGTIQEPRMATVTASTTLRIRSGATVALSASSPQSGLPYDGNELVFLVKATPVSF